MRIIMATGGTGGHVFPALQVARELKKNNHDILFLSSGGVAAQIIERNGFDLIFLSAEGVRFRPLKSFLKSIFSIFRATKEAHRFLLDFSPDIVVGFGGYGGFPVILAAIFLRYPTFIHEQNVVPGRANRLLSKFVKRIAISFSESQRHFNPRKVVLTGCPCRQPNDKLVKNQLLSKFNFSPDKPIILVLGGSQGSHRINCEFFEAAKLLKTELDFQVIHITGPKDFEFMKEKYAGCGIPVHVFGFLNEMEEVYQIANVVISRAGAVTVSELAAFRLRGILIPYPYAGGHQRWNAKVLENCGLAKIIDESDLTALKLKEMIQETLRSQGAPDTIAEKVKHFYFPDSASRVAQTIIGLTHAK